MNGFKDSCRMQLEPQRNADLKKTVLQVIQEVFTIKYVRRWHAWPRSCTEAFGPSNLTDCGTRKQKVALCVNNFSHGIVEHSNHCRTAFKRNHRKDCNKFCDVLLKIRYSRTLELTQSFGCCIEKISLQISMRRLYS
jgi:hypothetical protein